MVRAARLWHRKSPYRVSSRLGFAMRRLENSLCQLSSKWVPFWNKGGIKQLKERDWLRLSSAVPKISWSLTPAAPTAIRLWETFTSFFTKKLKEMWPSYILSTGLVANQMDELNSPIHT